MKFTAQQIEAIKSAAESSWEDNDREGELSQWIVSSALSDAFYAGLVEEYGDQIRHYDDLPVIDNFHFDGKQVKAANWINGRAFSDERALDRILFASLDTVNSQLEQLLA